MAEIEELERQLTPNAEQLEQARSAGQEATAEVAAAATRAATAQARADVLQEAHDALLQRIIPEQPPSGEELDA